MISPACDSHAPVEGPAAGRYGRAESENPFTVADAPPLVPQDQSGNAKPESAPKFDPGVPDEAETIAARRVRQTYVDRKDQRSLLRRLVSLPMLIVAMLAILLGALNWRAAVVRHFPQTASLYAAIGLPVNLRGLFFEDVKSTGEFQDGVTVLIVEGTIVNLTTPHARSAAAAPCAAQQRRPRGLCLDRAAAEDDARLGQRAAVPRAARFAAARRPRRDRALLQPARCRRRFTVRARLAAFA